MAVPEQTPYKEYTANGNTTSFALGFICDSKNDLIVLVDNVAPPVATWSLVGNNAVFTTAPASGKKIVLQRNTAMSRTTNYQGNNNSFRPETINKDIDRVWLKLQELGVADMLLKIYVDRLHGEQKDYIDNKDQLVRNIITDLRNYVNQQDGSLSSDINNLRTHVNQQDNSLAQSITNLRNDTNQLHNNQKDYIDQQDNNRNSYFENLISRQGVSLQQLDSYYNYLMQRIAQISVDKGWDASFVVDASGKNQQQVNDILFVRTKNSVDYGADPTGVTGSADAIEAMLADGLFCFTTGVYLIEREISVDISSISTIKCDTGVIFRINGNYSAFRFYDIDKDLDLNASVLLVDVVNYSGVGIEFEGWRDIWPSKITLNNKRKVRGISAKLTSVVDGVGGNRTGTAFSITAARTDYDTYHTFIDFELSARDFENALQLKCDGSSGNFMSTLNVDLTSWWCTNALVDASTGSGRDIADCTFNLNIQPHSTFKKAVKVLSGAGRIKVSQISLNFWDPQVVSNISGLVDASVRNRYTTSLLEGAGTVISKMLNYVDSEAPLAPNKVYSSRLTDSDKATYSDTFKIINLIMVGCNLDTTGGVTALNVANAGSGYSSAPTVTITGSGSGARATATVSGGVITGFTITDSGAGYVGTVTVTISGGGGAGGTATATISNVTMDMKKACQLIKANVDAVKYRHNFKVEFSASIGAYAAVTLAFFKHFYNHYAPFCGDSGLGKWEVEVEWFEGEVRIVSVDYKFRLTFTTSVDTPSVTHIRTEYAQYSNRCVSLLNRVNPTSKANIDLIPSKFSLVAGYGPVFDTTSGKPLWYAGSNVWKDAAGTVV